jgi:uncharacterized protein YdaU (DUF1376 family)
MSKKTDIWMPEYIGDFFAETAFMTTEQVGAYQLLKAAYWKNQGPLEYDLDSLCTLAKISGKNRYQRLSGALKPFTLADKQISHERLDELLINSIENRVKSSEKGKKGAQARWQGHSSGITQAMPSTMPGDSSSSLSSSTDLDTKDLVLTAVPQDPPPKEKINEKESGKELVEFAPLYPGCEYFRITEHEKELVKANWTEKGWDLRMLRDTVFIIEQWLASDTTEAKKARKIPTHYRRLRDHRFLKTALEARKTGAQSNGPQNMGQAFEEHFGHKPTFKQIDKINKFTAIEKRKQELENEKNIITIEAK